MISHAHKCIFIHIPRCAGTSVEEWICGHDWWSVEPQSKHLLASQARKIYRQWWDDYFKFSIVREPNDRTRSLLKHAGHFGLAREAGKPINFSGYRRFFGEGVTVEHDHRFANLNQIVRPTHRSGSVYGNILDEPLDFIGRFETLADDMALVRDRIGCGSRFASHAEKSEADDDLTDQDREWVGATYAHDFTRFGYGRR